MNDVLFAENDLVTAAGYGKESFFRALYEGRNTFRKVTAFPFPRDTVGTAAILEGIREQEPGRSAVWGMLDYFDPVLRKIAEGSCLYLASTLGEIDLMNCQKEDTVFSLLTKLLKKYPFTAGHTVSASCSSGNLAILRAGERIRNGEIESAVIVGCDFAGEFACSGFSAIRALAKDLPHPYDADRDGLLLGDAAGIIHLVSRDYAEKNQIRIEGRLTGWGCSCDAVHITAPDLSGNELARAIRKALAFPENKGLLPDCVIGHGTGTVLNDAMELNALRQIFTDPVPLASTKGCCGHTLGAAGLIQTIAALEVLKRKELFPQTGLRTPDPKANVAFVTRPVPGKTILTLNAGFGGVNAVLTVGEAS